MVQEAQQKSPLDLWVSRLSQEEMPAFAHTARSLAYVSREEDSSANDLANVILHDTAMTARILRLANSVQYNASGHAIETVSYAIVVLGFEEVRNLALTIAMIDTVLDSAHQEKVQHEMICAYHAAVQAKRLAERAGSDNLEAVYIGALLHRLGPIMFWCFPFSFAEQLVSRLSAGVQAQQAEREILGFSLNELTSNLVAEWHLSAMLDEALQSKDSRGGDDRFVLQGLGIAEATAEGWNSASFQSQLTSISKQLGMTEKETRLYIIDGAKLANDGLVSFGFPETKALLPPADDSLENQPEATENTADLELAILRQLTHMLGEDMDLNKVVMAVLEGVYRVLGMDNVMFAVASHGTGSLQAKFMLGQQRDEIMNRKLLPGSGEFLEFLQVSSNAFWHSATVPVYSGKADPLIQSIGATEYFMHPVVLSGRALGVVYADRKSSNRPFTAANLQSFMHLCDHVTLAFKILAKKT